MTALRPRLEHAQILTEADMARFGDLGGTFSPQSFKFTRSSLFVIQ